MELGKYTEMNKVMKMVEKEIEKYNPTYLGFSLIDGNVDASLYTTYYIKKRFPNAKVKNIYASTEAGSIFASDGDLFKIPTKFESLIKIENNEDENFVENKKILLEKLSELHRNYNLNLGKLSELNNNKIKSEAEMRNDNYYEIESRYNKCKMEYIASVETSKYIDM